MATYFVWDGGNNGDGLSWANAKTTLAGAIALASASGDVIKVAHTHTGDNALVSDTTWTALNNISIVSVDKGNADTPTPMGTAAWLGSSSTSVALTVTGAYRILLSGLTLRNGGATSKSIEFAKADGGTLIIENSYIWLGTSGSTTWINLGPLAASNSNVTVKNSTFRFGHASQTLYSAGSNSFLGCTISSDGIAPITLFGSSTYGTSIDLIGCDFSHCGYGSPVGSGTLVANQATYSSIFRFIQCKLCTNYVARTTPTSPANASNGQTWIVDCSSGDAHGIFGFFDGQGALTSDTGVYVTSGAAQQSWKVVTTSGNGPERPFTTPWISLYNTATASITPYLDILRDDSTTAYKDTEVWAEFRAKTAGGSPISTGYSDAGTLLSAGSNQATSSLGAGDWTGESGTNWYGKCDAGSAFTPAEAGDILGRICFAVPSATIRIDPFIKT